MTDFYISPPGGAILVAKTVTIKMAPPGGEILEIRRIVASYY